MTPTPPNRSELRSLLERIATDPDAGQWAEWARRMMAGNRPHEQRLQEREDVPDKKRPPARLGQASGRYYAPCGERR